MFILWAPTGTTNPKKTFETEAAANQAASNSSNVYDKEVFVAELKSRFIPNPKDPKIILGKLNAVGKNKNICIVDTNYQQYFGKIHSFDSNNLLIKNLFNHTTSFSILSIKEIYVIENNELKRV